MPCIHEARRVTLRGSALLEDVRRSQNGSPRQCRAPRAGKCTAGRFAAASTEPVSVVIACPRKRQLHEADAEIRADAVLWAHWQGPTLAPRRGGALSAYERMEALRLRVQCKAFEGLAL